MTVMIADRGANASVLAAAVAAMVGVAFVASVGLYIVAVHSQPDILPRTASKPKPVAVKLAKPVAAPAITPTTVAPHAEWMDRAIRANP